MPNRSRLGIRSALIRSAFALGLLFAAIDAFAQAPLCVADAHTLCLNGDRFSVIASSQQTPSGPSVSATAVPLTADTGYFWFFDASNVELIVKVLNGCVEPFDSYWFFAAGLTNLGVEISVKDLRTGDARNYTSPVGTPFAPIQDTSAFRTCP